jgi:hypothetical protein
MKELLVNLIAFVFCFVIPFLAVVMMIIADHFFGSK